jgi:hypothetical protein
VNQYDSGIANGATCTVTGDDDKSSRLAYSISFDDDGTNYYFQDSSPVALPYHGNHTFNEHTWNLAGFVDVRAQVQELSNDGNLGKISDECSFKVEVKPYSGPVKGKCTSITTTGGKTFCAESTPAKNELCSPGNPIPFPYAIPSSGVATWDCGGLNGGDSDIGCKAGIIEKPACAHKEFCRDDLPASCGYDWCGGATNECSDLADAGDRTNFKWQCSNSACGFNSPCSDTYLEEENGECGDWNGCTNAGGDKCKPGHGTYYYISGSEDGYELQWQCDGQCDGTNSPICSARGRKACGWVETNP